ncbi:MAG: DNA internalization-related competence protein ComEC/Rec2 [Anaerolineae bacterium]|nr:DNA internalization-related competence protein ComEC/Rec2 [Anaerolineae bacterium]
MTPLVAFTAAWALGIVFAQAAFLHPIWLLLALPAALVLHFGTAGNRRAILAVWALAGLALGAGRYLLAQPTFDAGHVSTYNGATAVTLTGIVTGEPDARATYIHLPVTAENLRLSNGAEIAVRGQVLVRASPFTPACYGDRIAVTGALETPPAFEEFSYRDYLARRGIYTLVREGRVEILASHQAGRVREILYRFKAHALATVLRLLPEPQASLLAGILLGVESGISEELNAAFSATGASHIVAISGFNLTLVAGVLATVARRFLGRKGQLPVVLGGVWLYTILVGASAAVVRAAVMGSLVIIARRDERPIHGPTSLALAALVMSAANPLILWDVGFQLGLAATAGLIFFTEPLTELFQRMLLRLMSSQRAEIFMGWLSEALIVTLAAQLTTLPIIVATFQRLSLVTLLTNLLILPAQPFVMVCGGAALLIGLFILPVGQIIAWFAWVFLTYTITMVNLTAGIPLASIPVGQIGLPLVWAYYLALAIGTWLYSQSPAQRREHWELLLHLGTWQRVGALTALVLGGVFLYMRPDGRLHVTFLDVGQGDAVLIQTPAGRQVLIDGGPEASRMLSQLGEQLPFWDRELDAVILTSPDAARLTGLIAVLERYKVQRVATGAEIGRGDIYERWLEILAARDPGSVSVLMAGDVWELDDAGQLQVLWPLSEVEAGPLVLRLDYGEASFLLAGDATTVVEEHLAQSSPTALQAEVLQVARNGAATSSTPAFLEAVAPSVAVISVSADNYSGNPAPQLLARLLDTVVYRTDRCGTIEVLYDGHELKVESGCPSR